MKRYFFCLLFLCSITILCSQHIETKKCLTCGKALAHCQFKGKHPKTNTPTATTPSKPASSITTHSQQSSVTFYSNVSDSKLWIDNDYIGVLPVTIKLPDGYYNIRVVSSGYNSLDKRVFIQQKEKEYYITMTEYKTFGNLESSIQTTNPNTLYTTTIRTNINDAKLWIDNDYMGSLPVTTNMKKGLHKIRIVASGYNSHESNINVLNNGQVFNITMEKYKPFN